MTVLVLGSKCAPQPKPREPTAPDMPRCARPPKITDRTRRAKRSPPAGPRGAHLYRNVRVRIQPVGLQAHQPTVVAVIAHVMVLRLVFLMRACHLQVLRPDAAPHQGDRTAVLASCWMRRVWRPATTGWSQATASTYPIPR